jgi:microcystin degradation protein MlrC
MVRRVAVAQIAHETNVFSAVPTDFAAFQASGLLVGEPVLATARGTNSEIAGFIDGAEERGFTLVPIISVWATPSGLVTRDAIEKVTALYRDGLRRALASGPLDGILLALHGAMVTELADDGESELLSETRRVFGDSIPIVVTLDLHANISPAMVALGDLLIGYKTYPHVDMAERGREACAVLDRLIRREVRPATALRKPPMLPTSQRMTTDRVPMRALIDHAQQMEIDQRVINVTIAGGFPAGDNADAGLSVLVTTDGDHDLANQLADQLAMEAWQQRAGFLGGVTPFVDAAALIRDMDRGKLPGTGPLVLVDIGDNPWTGGPGDSAELVRFLFRERVEGAAVALVKDPDVVKQCVEAGPGASLTLELGGKTDQLHGESLPLRAYVTLISDGRYLNDGPMMAGVGVDLGPTARLRCSPLEGEAGASVDVLVTSRAETPIDLNVFRAHGIEPALCRVLGLKGKGHFRAAFEPIARRVILVEGPGITGADLSRLKFTKIRRPIWPLDEAVDYRGSA